MAKIIQRGPTHDDKKFRVTCTHCRSVIEYEGREGKPVSDQREGDALVFQCAVCHQSIWTSLKGGNEQQWER